MKTSKQPLNDYFKQAKHWADDQFARVEVSRNRYQVAFLASMGLNLCAVLAVSVLAPMQTLIPMLVHHYDNGVMTIEPVTQANAPINKTQVESDIVRYITQRESYEVSAYRSQFDLVSLLSSGSVNDEYLREQSKSNSQSPVVQLGNKAMRSVHVYSINFLDNVLFNDQDFPKNHHNVAEVVFTLIDTDKATGQQTETQYSAVIAWVYNQPSNAPDIRWKNWDGFQVTRYSKQLRNV
ncbi:virB8 family protein [Legionella sp. 16cNR16C]|uniref:virB8 family protein n=1 Tax=Legionella sp. 16cNR16C TaxID=2905656 RepID=UPI001E4EF63B|nr:type IV secretion system protein [Legionella sp. 16cNR16C]MCE3043973.1 type IV secretion system protein [Legionella sp. 16cNR16C]